MLCEEDVRVSHAGFSWMARLKTTLSRRKTKYLTATLNPAGHYTIHFR